MYTKLALLPSWNTFKPILLKIEEVQEFNAKCMKPWVALDLHSEADLKKHTAEFVKYYGWIDNYRQAVCRALTKCFDSDGSSGGYGRDMTCEPCSAKDLKDAILLLSEYKSLLVHSGSERWKQAIHHDVMAGHETESKPWDTFIQDIISANTKRDEDHATSADKSLEDDLEIWYGRIYKGFSSSTSAAPDLSGEYPFSWNGGGCSEDFSVSHVRLLYRYSWDGGAVVSWDNKVEIVGNYNLAVCSLLYLFLDYESIGTTTNYHSDPLDSSPLKSYDEENLPTDIEHTFYNDATLVGKNLKHNECCSNTLNFFKWFDPAIVVKNCWSLYGIRTETVRTANGSTCGKELEDQEMEINVARNFLTDMDTSSGVFNEKVQMKKEKDVWSAKHLNHMMKTQLDHLKRVRNTCLDILILLEQLLYTLDSFDNNLRSRISYNVAPSKEDNTYATSTVKDVRLSIGNSAFRACGFLLKLNKEHVTYMGRIVEMLAGLLELDLVRLNSFSKTFIADKDTSEQPNSEAYRRENGLNYWTYFYSVLKGVSKVGQLENSMKRAVSRYLQVISPVITSVLDQKKLRKRTITEEVKDELESWVSTLTESPMTVVKGLSKQELHYLKEWTKLPKSTPTDFFSSAGLRMYPYQVMGMGQLLSYGQLLSDYVESIFSHFCALQEAFIIWDNSGTNNVHNVHALAYYDSLSSLCASAQHISGLLNYRQSWGKLSLVNYRSCEQIRWLLNAISCMQRVLLRYQNTYHLKRCSEAAELQLPPKFTRLHVRGLWKFGECIVGSRDRVIAKELRGISRAAKKIVLWNEYNSQYASTLSLSNIKTNESNLDPDLDRNITTSETGATGAIFSSNRAKNINEKIYNILQFLSGKVCLETNDLNIIYKLRLSKSSELTQSNVPHHFTVHHISTLQEIELDTLRLWSTFWLVNGGVVELERHLVRVKKTESYEPYHSLLLEEFSFLPSAVQYACLEETYRMAMTY